MKNKKVQLIFTLLLLYVVAQSIWWMYSIYNLSGKLYPPAELEKKKWMIFGEGGVFLILLCFGLYFTLKSIKKELKLSNQQKNFLMAVTHELKTPISSIKLYIQTLLKRDLEKEKQDDILTKSLADTDRLNNLVEGILLATKIDDHSIQISKQKFNLSDLTREIGLKMMESNLKKMHFEFLVEEDIFLDGDQDSFVSIITNLIGNGIKYSPEASTLTISLNEKDDSLEFSVADEGKGIPNSEKNNIFKKFYRIGDENTRSQQGTGLGLFIVKYLVELHEGKISVQNNSPKGAIFACTFKSI